MSELRERLEEIRRSPAGQLALLRPRFDLVVDGEQERETKRRTGRRTCG